MQWNQLIFLQGQMMEEVNRLDRGRADEKCVIHCEDGNFTMPKMRLVFQEAEA